MLWLVYGKNKLPHEFSNVAAPNKVCNHISAGLKKVKHKPLFAARVCSLMDWATPENPNGVTFNYLQKMAETGETFEYKGFLSAAPLEYTTFSNDGSQSVARHFYVPEKASGGYIDILSKFSEASGCHEYEFLLDKETKTRIIEAEKYIDGIIHTYEHSCNGLK